MQTGYSGCLRQRLVSSSTSRSAAAGIGALARHQFGTSQALHKRLQPHGVKNAKQRFSRLNVSATKDLPLVILDRDFDKEGSRVYKRTVRATRLTAATRQQQLRIWHKLLLACRFSPSATGLRTGVQSAIAGIYTPFLG